MALEFASKHETFPNFKTFEMELAGRPLVVETGKMCGLSNGSCLVRYGETAVLCNVTMSEKPRDGIDFFPLSVDFEEKLYSVGRIPGSFMRREGRPGEKAILTSRVVDRPIRPLFPKTMRNDVCVTMTVMSVDQDCSPEITGMIGTSIALSISDIPWAGPIGGVFMGLVDGQLVVNPTLEQREKSDLQLTVAATEKKIVMIEAGANEVDEVTMLNAIKAAHVEIKKVIEFINGIVAEIGKPKKPFQDMELDHDLFEAVKAEYLDEFKAAMDTDDKNVRDARLLPIREKLEAQYAEQWGASVIEELMYKMQKFVVRRWLLDEGKRVDGRGINEIRPLAAEVGLLPRVHGSGMFTRGQTQVLTVTTLGSTKDSQLMDDLGTEPYKRYIHHYNFPPYSVGEARAPRSPGRREIGHGALAERALIPVLPSVEEFPYTIRLVSEVLSSNGSTSQASICGSTLSLMDAGVPIKAPVAGISCGLITEGERWMTMLDIQGVEDFHGDMDFKVGGTHKGITAIQMDIKIDGLTYEIIEEAFEKCRKGRLFILDEIMLPVIPAPREQLSKYAGGRPRVRLRHRRGRRQPCHPHHQDHRGGPRGGRHLQGPRDPSDELRRLRGDRPGQGRPGAHLQAGHQACRAGGGRGRRGRRADRHGHRDRPAGPHQPEPQGRSGRHRGQAQAAGLSKIKQEPPHPDGCGGFFCAAQRGGHLPCCPGGSFVVYYTRLFL